MKKQFTILLLLLVVGSSCLAGGASLGGLVGQWQYEMHVNNEDIDGSATTLGAAANFNYPVGEQLAMGVEATFNLIKGEAEGAPYLDGGNDIFAGATVQYNLPFEGGTAYAAAGGGMRLFKLDVGEAGGQLNTRQYKVAGALLGGGVSYEASPTLQVVGDVRFLLPLSNLQLMDDQGFQDEGAADGGLLALSAGAQFEIAENMLAEVRGRFSKEDFQGSLGDEKISGTSFGVAAGIQFSF